MATKYNLYKKHETDSVWWVDNFDTIGEHLFTFDKRKVYNLFADYPYKLTPQERKVFALENPEWRQFFSERVAILERANTFAKEHGFNAVEHVGIYNGWDVFAVHDGGGINQDAPESINQDAPAYIIANSGGGIRFADDEECAAINTGCGG